MDKYMKIKYLYLNYKKLSKKFKKNKFKLYALRKGFVARASGFRNLKHFLYNDFIKEYSLYKNFTDFQLKRLRMKLQRWYFRMPFRSVYDAIHFHHLEKGLPRFIFPYYFRMLAYGMIFIKRYSFYYFRGKRNIRYCRSGIILRNFRLYLIKYFAKYYQYYRGLFNSKSFLYNFQVYIDPNIYKYDSTLHHCYYYLFPIYHSFISRDINKSSKILANYYRDTSNLSFNYTFFRVFDINDMYSYIRNFTSTHLFDASYNGKFFMILKHDIDIPKNYQYQRDVSHLPFYSKINNNVFKRWVKDRYNIRDNFKNVPYTYNRRRFDYRYDDHFTFSQNSYY